MVPPFLRSLTSLILMALHLDACLLGMGAIWHDRVYTTPVPAILRFDLKTVHLEMLNIIEALGSTMTALTSKDHL